MASGKCLSSDNNIRKANPRPNTPPSDFSDSASLWNRSEAESLLSQMNVSVPLLLDIPSRQQIAIPGREDKHSELCRILTSALELINDDDDDDRTDDDQEQAQVNRR